MNILSKPWMLGLLFTVNCIFTDTGNISAQSRSSAAYQNFYEELAPYGRWLNHREFGRVWIPDVDRDFQPYCSEGHWIVTEYGNTWVSDYEWGWAPFHYGQWFFDDRYGWAWIPGREWAPAWVEWRSGNGYYGWAPMGPINSMRYAPRETYWVFVPQRYICSRYVYNYRVPRNQSFRIYQNTAVINNYYSYSTGRYAMGPRSEELERVTRSRVRVYDVHAADKPGRTYTDINSVRIYRPEYSRDRNYSSDGNKEQNYSRRYDNSVYNDQNNRSSDYNRDSRNRDQSYNDSKNTNRSADRWNGQQSESTRPSREAYPSRTEAERNQIQPEKTSETDVTSTRQQPQEARIQPERTWDRRPQRQIGNDQPAASRRSEVKPAEPNNASKEQNTDNLQEKQQSSRPSRRGN